MAGKNQDKANKIVAESLRARSEREQGYRETVLHFDEPLAPGALLMRVNKTTQDRKGLTLNLSRGSDLET